MDNGILFKEGKDSILFYQTANKDLNGEYRRTGYIHPLYTMDGQILTEDFPADHLHHRGIFWAWHQLYVGDNRMGDGWETKDFEWEVLSVKEIREKGKKKSIAAHVIWKSPFFFDSLGKEKILVNEYTTITVYPAEKDYRMIDMQISLLAANPNMYIGGSEDAKGYGGFSARIRLTDDVKFTGSTGDIMPQLLPIHAGGWMDITESLGPAGTKAGVAILNHPKNPGYPNPWILRSSKSMQNVVYPYPGATAVSLSDTEPTVLQYRIVIHDGDKRIGLEKLYNKYSNMH